MAETAWVRFVRRLPRNESLLGEGPDLREFLFGSDRSALDTVRDVLREVEGNRCFYCAGDRRHHGHVESPPQPDPGAPGRPPLAPHGPEWRQLMALAGYPEARGAHWRGHRPNGHSLRPGKPPKPKARPPLYDHWCPVCQSSRTGRRPVEAWWCAACVAAGLDGKLEITRRATRPAKAR